MDNRPSWTEYFLDIADAVSKRATCNRKLVGCIIVKDKQILASGFNGAIRGADHCTEVGHMMEDSHCVRVVHSEANAIVQAAKHGISVEGATIYVNTYPCWRCFGLIANSGISKIVYRDNYRNDERIQKIADQLGIIIYHFEKKNET